MSTRATGGDPPPGPADVALMQSPGFWLIVRHAILFGVVLAFAALAFLGIGDVRHRPLVHPSR